MIFIQSFPVKNIKSYKYIYNKNDKSSSSRIEYVCRAFFLCVELEKMKIES